MAGEITRDPRRLLPFLRLVAGGVCGPHGGPHADQLRGGPRRRAGRDAGLPELFAALRTAPETADIAAAFESEILKSDDPALATAAAFDAWYGSEIRRERYYVSTCMDYLDRIERDAQFPGTAKLTAGFLTRICNLPDGSTYPCDEPEAPLPR